MISSIAPQVASLAEEARHAFHYYEEQHGQHLTEWSSLLSSTAAIRRRWRYNGALLGTPAFTLREQQQYTTRPNG